MVAGKVFGAGLAVRSTAMARGQESVPEAALVLKAYQYRNECCHRPASRTHSDPPLHVTSYDDQMRD